MQKDNLDTKILTIFILTGINSFNEPWEKMISD
jgi:hypothetical protein